MEPLDKIDLFEAFDVHVFVQDLVLGVLLISFEFFAPLFVSFGKAAAQQFPGSHGEAGLAESGVASEEHDGEDGGADSEHPIPDFFVVRSLYVEIIDPVDENRLGANPFKGQSRR